MKRIVFYLAVSSFIISCEKSKKYVNTSAFPKTEGTTLAFDLSTSPHYEAKLLVQNSYPGKEYKYFIPLRVSESKNSEEILSSVGNYEKYTYISYIGRGNNNTIAIGFRPSILDFEPADIYTNPPNEGTYFIKNGLQRIFVYNYDYLKNNNSLERSPSSSFDTLSFIAIKLPLKSEGREIENGKTTIPEPISSNDNIKIFPGNHPGLLKVKYELNEELTKTNLFLLLVKSFLLVVIPLLSIIFLPSVSNDKSKKLWFYIALSIELLLLVIMIVLGINGRYIGFDNMIDSVTTGTVAILTSILIYKTSIKQPTKTL